MSSDIITPDIPLDLPDGFGTGLIPRDYKSHPPGCYAGVPVFDTALIVPESEWAQRFQDQQGNKTSLYDLRITYYDVLKSLDQNGFGLCWAFSTTKAGMYLLARMNPGLAVRLAAYWVAGKVKGWRDEGGWNTQSLEQIIQSGVPEERFCPQYRSSYDTTECRENAAKHKITEWWDGTDSREQNRRIMISAFLLGLPMALDFNWLSHSMAGCRLVSLDPLTIDCDNSWGETSQYGEKGLYRISGSRAIPDGISVSRVIMAA